MTPHDRLKQRVEQLIDQGCTLDTALQRVLREQNNTTIEQSELLDLKHQIQLDMELEEGVSKKKRSEEKKGITLSKVIFYFVVIVVIILLLAIYFS